MKSSPYTIEPIGFVRSELTRLEEAPMQGDEGAPEAWLEDNPEFGAPISRDTLNPAANAAHHDIDDPLPKPGTDRLSFASHPDAIILDVEQRTGGELRLSAGTLYRSIQRMLEQNLIRETRDRPAPELDDERRRYYRITPFGTAVASAEAKRMSDLVKMARAQGLVPARA